VPFFHGSCELDLPCAVPEKAKVSPSAVCKSHHSRGSQVPPPKAMKAKTKLPLKRRRRRQGLAPDPSGWEAAAPKPLACGGFGGRQRPSPPE
jgi:hypothetical protein